MFSEGGPSVLAIKCMGFVAVVCHSEVILVHLSEWRSIASEALLKPNLHSPCSPGPLCSSAPLAGAQGVRAPSSSLVPLTSLFLNSALPRGSHVSLLIATISASLLCPACKRSGCCWEHSWDVILLGLRTGVLLLERCPQSSCRLPSSFLFVSAQVSSPQRPSPTSLNRAQPPRSFDLSVLLCFFIAFLTTGSPSVDLFLRVCVSHLHQTAGFMAGSAAVSFCSRLYLQHVGQYLAHLRCSVNIC